VKLVVASRNRHKLAELGRIMDGVELEPLPAEVTLPPEDGETYGQNALAKARAAAAALGRPAIGEDSGIEAEALGGAPGVRSARFASAGEGNAPDEANTAKLLAKAPAGSRLRYVCALAYVDPRSGSELVFHGSCEGVLAERPRGTGGFGYDPVFVPVEQEGELTMAELSPERKDQISHRGRAARALLGWLREAKGNWVKRDDRTGRFMDIKTDGKPFKGVRRET